MEVTKILKIAQRAARIILESGGEIYRVEETIERICFAYGLTEVDVFVTPSMIIISIDSDESKPRMLLKRIKSRTVDFSRIEDVNCLSRRIATDKLSLDVVSKELDEISSTPRYSDISSVLASGLITGCFALFFGGSFIDFIPAAVTGFLIRILVLRLRKIQMNDFFINVVGGALATFLALFFNHLGISNHPNEIVIGSIMLLVPGLGITNGIRDTISGDLLSGITRSIDAFFVAIAIAIGSAIVYQLYFFLLGGSI